MMRSKAGTLVALGSALALAACSDSTAPTGSGVAIRLSAAVTSGDGVTALQQNGSASITGMNGTLQLDSLLVIVERFRLQRTDHDADCANDTCEWFSMPARLLSLPLDGTGVIAVQEEVSPGTYRRLRFEIDDLDDDSPAEQLLLAAIRAQFPAWPKDASLLAIGTFTPTGGTPLAFRTFIEADVRIDLTLSPPAIVDRVGTITVSLDLVTFFRTGSGQILDLAQFDSARAGALPRLRVEITDGSTRAEFRR
jgi:hypothetical protein